MLILSTLLMGAPALAQDTLELDPSLPIPSLKYDRPAPDFSWEIGVHMGFGEVTYWMQEIPPWVSFGVRAGWGRNLPSNHHHRLGVTALFFAEGPMPIHMTLGVDPQFSWDVVTESGLWMGAGVGAAVMFHSKDVGNQTVTASSLGPSASARLGWSQTWSRVGRRFFIGAEPRIRVTNGNVGWSASVVLGSGKGY